MTVLSDLRARQLFLYVGRVTAVDAVNGMDLDLYGPSRTKTATAHIAIDGTMTGQLAAAPNETPVMVVTANFAPISVGDILENVKTGETLVCRVSRISPKGVVMWSSSVNGTVAYTADNWNVVGHIDL